MEWALLCKASLLPSTGQIEGWTLTESESQIKGPTLNQKIYKQQMLERVWRKGNPLALLAGMQTSTGTMENSVEIP